MNQFDSRTALTRRALLQSGLGVGALLAHPIVAFASAPPSFEQWRDGFRARAIAKGINAPDTKAFLSNMGVEPAGTTPQEFGAFIKSEMVKWAKVVKDAGIPTQ